MVRTPPKKASKSSNPPKETLKAQPSNSNEKWERSTTVSLAVITCLVSGISTIVINLYNYWQLGPPFTTPPISITHHDTYKGNLVGVIGYNICSASALVLGWQIVKRYFYLFWPRDCFQIIWIGMTWVMFCGLLSTQAVYVLETKGMVPIPRSIPLKERKQWLYDNMPFLPQNSALHAGSALALFLLVLFNLISSISLYCGHKLHVPYVRYLAVVMHLTGFMGGPFISEYAREYVRDNYKRAWTEVDEVNLMGLCQYCVVSSLFIYAGSFYFDKVVNSKSVRTNLYALVEEGNDFSSYYGQGRNSQYSNYSSDGGVEMNDVNDLDNANDDDVYFSKNQKNNLSASYKPSLKARG